MSFSSSGPMWLPLQLFLSRCFVQCAANGANGFISKHENEEDCIMFKTGVLQTVVWHRPRRCVLQSAHWIDWLIRWTRLQLHNGVGARAGRYFSHPRSGLSG